MSVMLATGVPASSQRIGDPRLAKYAARAAALGSAEAGHNRQVVTASLVSISDRRTRRTAA